MGLRVIAVNFCVPTCVGVGFLRLLGYQQATSATRFAATNSRNAAVRRFECVSTPGRTGLASMKTGTVVRTHPFGLALYEDARLGRLAMKDYTQKKLYPQVCAHVCEITNHPPPSCTTPWDSNLCDRTTCGFVRFIMSYLVPAALLGLYFYALSKPLYAKHAWKVRNNRSYGMREHKYWRNWQVSIHCRV